MKCVLGVFIFIPTSWIITSGLERLTYASISTVKSYSMVGMTAEMNLRNRKRYLHKQ